MWEEQIIEESGGKIAPSDLIWHPDPLISSPAFLAKSPYSSEVEQPLVGRSSVNVDYYVPVGSSTGALWLRKRLLNRPTLKPPDELFGPLLCWFSPLMSLREVDSAISASGRQPANADQSYDFTHRLPADYPIKNERTPSAVTACWDGFAHEVLRGDSSKAEEPKLPVQPLVDGYFWDTLKASPSTQLALTLMGADHLLSHQKAVDYVFTGVRIDVLTEVAKIRALRILLSHLHSLYGLPSWSGTLLGIMSPVCMSAKDPDNNLIRGSIAAIAGISGGVDALTLQPWNLFSEKYADSEAALTSVRIFDLLCEESRLDKTWDPFAGAYNVEYLTEEMVQKAWDLFLEMRSISTESLKKTLFNDLLPKDEQSFQQSGRHSKAKKQRSVVGDTIYPSPDAVSPSENMSNASQNGSAVDLFPLDGPRTLLSSMNPGGPVL